MGLLICFALLISSMLVCLAENVSMIYPLALGLAGFLTLGARRGHSWPDLAAMCWQGAKRSFIVLRVFIFIGCLTAAWRFSGVIAFCVYYSVQSLSPPLFILTCFVLNCLLSYALGTSLGVAGTVGVILITIARAGGVDIVITAGAIMSGIYLGDRCSPASSCAHLVAALTHTPIYDNIRLMTRAALLPLALSLLVYGVLSWLHPLQALDAGLLNSISGGFNLTPWCLLPLGLMLILPLVRVRVELAMTASIAASCLVAIAAQAVAPSDALRALITGYAPADPALALFSGGGLLSMANVAVIVMLSCAYSGIFQGAHLLDSLYGFRDRLVGQWGRFPVMLLCSILSCCMFCNQTIGVMFCHQLLAGAYKQDQAGSLELMLDVANSVVVIAALVPWALACAVPLAMLNVSAAAVPWSFYLYAIPLCYLFTRKRMVARLRK